MKLLFCLITILTLNTECGQNNTSEASNTNLNSENSTRMQNYSKISYEASTRGFYEKIWITNDSITITNDRDHKVLTQHPTSKQDWNDLMTLLKDVNIKDLPNLESPTATRNYDGAAIATLTVEVDKTETKSNNFDHGNPPKAIEAVVNKVLSIKKRYEKN